MTADEVAIAIFIDKFVVALSDMRAAVSALKHPWSQQQMRNCIAAVEGGLSDLKLALLNPEVTEALPLEKKMRDSQ